MLVKDLIQELEEFDQDEDFAVEVYFPQIGWHVTDFPRMVEYSEEGQPAFKVDVFECDFDFPDVLQRIKAQVDAIPEWAVHPEARRGLG
ncbi:MAG: hypothetical protein ACI36W_02825 [Coriobacteriales bacterium]